MTFKNENEGLRVRSKVKNDLDMLLFTVMAAVPFMPYVLSGALIALICPALMISKRGRNIMMSNRFFFGVTLIISFISAFSSTVAGNFIGVLISLGVFLILSFASYTRSVMTAEIFKRITHVTVIGSLTSFVVTLLQKMKTEGKYFRPSGFSFNANYLGAVSVLALLLLTVAFFENWSKEKLKSITFWIEKLLFALGVAANVLVILICKSRSSLLAITVAVFLYFVLKKWYVLCTVILGCGIALWVIGYKNPDTFGWQNSLAEVFISRYGIWLCALSIVISNPVQFLIGKGPMTYYHSQNLGLIDKKWNDPNWLFENGFIDKVTSPDAGIIYSAHHAHNLFVDILLNVGLLGFISYGALFFDFFRQGINKLKNADNTAFRVIMIALCAIVVQGIPDVTIMWHQTAILFVLMCSASCKE